MYQKPPLSAGFPSDSHCIYTITDTVILRVLQIFYDTSKEKANHEVQSVHFNAHDNLMLLKIVLEGTKRAAERELRNLINA